MTPPFPNPGSELKAGSRRAQSSVPSTARVLSVQPPSTDHPHPGQGATERAGQSGGASDDDILAARQRGLSIFDITVELNVGVQRVRRVLGAAGLGTTAIRRTNGRALTAKQCARAAALRAEGLSWSAIGRSMGGLSARACRDGAARHTAQNTPQSQGA